MSYRHGVRDVVHGTSSAPRRAVRAGRRVDSDASPPAGARHQAGRHRAAVPREGGQRDLERAPDQGEGRPRPRDRGGRSGRSGPPRGLLVGRHGVAGGRDDDGHQPPRGAPLHRAKGCGLAFQQGVGGTMAASTSATTPRRSSSARRRFPSAPSSSAPGSSSMAWPTSTASSKKRPSAAGRIRCCASSRSGSSESCGTNAPVGGALTVVARRRYARFDPMTSDRWVDRATHGYAPRSSGRPFAPLRSSAGGFSC